MRDLKSWAKETKRRAQASAFGKQCLDKTRDLKSWAKETKRRAQASAFGKQCLDKTRDLKSWAKQAKRRAQVAAIAAALEFASWCVGAVAKDQVKSGALLSADDKYRILIKSLRRAISDVRSLRGALTEIDFPFEKIQTLVSDGDYNDRPSREAILAAFDELAAASENEPAVFIALSGREFGAEGVEAKKDGDKAATSETTRLIENVAQRLQEDDARFKLLIVDLCQEPAATESGATEKSDAFSPISAPDGASLQSCVKKEFDWGRSNIDGPGVAYFRAKRDLKDLRDLEDAEYKAGTRQTLQIKGLEYAFRYCPSGRFTMGSPEDEEKRYDEETQLNVTLTKGFWMLETPVTQAMWKSVMDSNPSRFQESERNPVERVSWNDCQDFIDKLNSSGVAPEGFRFRLPSEAEWEYACRAGTTTAYFWGDALNGDKANCNGKYPYGASTKGEYLKHTSEVGDYDANPWGLRDMHGNVWEWCEDKYAAYAASDSAVNMTRGDDRVLRGGSWCADAAFCRSANRCGSVPTNRGYDCGFRLALGDEF